jgi:hypothetical protein
MAGERIARDWLALQALLAGTHKKVGDRPILV